MPPLSNVRHEKYAQALAKGKSQHKAYAIAGYREHEGNASRLRSNEMVKARVMHLQEINAKRAEVTRESLLAELEEHRMGAVADHDWGPANQASGLKARITGKDAARVEVTHSFETMRSDEIEAALLKLLQDHGVIEQDPPMIDVTPESESQ